MTKYIKILIIALINAALLLAIIETKGRMLKNVLPFMILVLVGYIGYTFYKICTEKDEKNDEQN